MKKEDYEKLYEEYKILKTEMKYVFQVKQVIPSKTIEPRILHLNELYRYHEIKKILATEAKDYLDLKPDEWYEILQG